MRSQTAVIVMMYGPWNAPTQRAESSSPAAGSGVGVRYFSLPAWLVVRCEQRQQQQRWLAITTASFMVHLIDYYYTAFLPLVPGTRRVRKQYPTSTSIIRDRDGFAAASQY